MTTPRPFDPTRYAPLTTALLEAALDYGRHTSPEKRNGAYDRIRTARDNVIAAEDELKAKANKLEAKLEKFDHLPPEERPKGHAEGNANWCRILETYEMLWASRKCIELLMPWNSKPQEDK